MERKEDTPERVVRRKYEELHKEERRLKTKVWGTSIERSKAEEIDAFLERHKLSKVDLIYKGYETLKTRYEPNKRTDSEENSK